MASSIDAESALLLDRYVDSGTTASVTKYSAFSVCQKRTASIQTAAHHLLSLQIANQSSAKLYVFIV